ncbi:MAG: ribosome maturation factor RimM [Hyphomonadaceae bacterium]
MDEWVLIGAIEGAFGVQGEVRVKSFTAAPESIAAYGPLHDERGALVLTPKSWREIKGGLAIRAPEIKTREQAEALRNTGLYVARAQLPPAEDDEFYHVDLIGCAAFDAAGAEIGRVQAVHDFGAGEMVEIRADGKETLFIPFTKTAVPQIDIAGRRITIIPPEAEE